VLLLPLALGGIFFGSQGANRGLEERGYDAIGFGLPLAEFCLALLYVRLPPALGYRLAFESRLDSLLSVS
jgi:hypothetical protein